jgi:hypothetical protein
LNKLKQFFFTTVNLSDVSGIKNPLDKVQPGLVSTTGEACVLRSVHISAQLMDLASKVSKT